MSHFSGMTRFFATLLAALLILPAAQTTANAQQSETSHSQTQIAETQPESSLPEAPQPQSTAQNAPQDNSQQPPEQQQNNTPAPVGTAAAPTEKPVGAAGSKPAGAAIAPAKQRRVHTILISVGLIAGAGIAVGIVAALSHASPSQPH